MAKPKQEANQKLPRGSEPGRSHALGTPGIPSSVFENGTKYHWGMEITCPFRPVPPTWTGPNPAEMPVLRDQRLGAPVPHTTPPRQSPARAATEDPTFNYIYLVCVYERQVTRAEVRGQPGGVCSPL